MTALLELANVPPRPFSAIGRVEHVASFVELAGKCEILALSLPYVSEILTLSLGLIGR